MPRPCLICSDNAKLAKAAEMIAAGSSDQAVATALNALTPGAPAMSLMAVNRHRRLHIMKAAQDRLAIVAKGATQRQERQELATAVASGAPTPQQFVDAYFGLKAQAEKLQGIEDRLERMATLAEGNKSPTTVATVAAQQIRSVETGARLAGVGGYAPQKGVGVGDCQMFQVNIVLSSGERISVATGQPSTPPTLEASAIDDDQDDETLCATTVVEAAEVPVGGSTQHLEADRRPTEAADLPCMARLAAAFGAGVSR